MIQFFGARWDAPQVDPPAVQVATPIGEPCLHCGEAVEAGDRGLLRMAIRAGGAGVEPVHMECDLRMTLGGIDHLAGQCSCSGHHAGGQAAIYNSAREEATAVLAWWNQRRATTGQPPL
ncbi:hypothetical protein [Lentzea sp. NPDC092896]|uniref:hypothetical protein n=1 Tax=Lentzea sp. NPDC092896 TaxID=3364127 RepID=UPI00381F0BD4